MKDILERDERFSWIIFPSLLRGKGEGISMNQQEYLRKRELADFLRTRRERLLPEQLDLPGGGRRRTPGLRRDEAALLAGISVDLYTRLEQARPISVSEAVLESLAHALRLNEHEREHLFLLAHQHLPPKPETTSFAETVSPALQRHLNHMETSPAYILGKRWDILAWNQAALVLFGDYAHMHGRERNSLWLIFTSPYLRQLLVDWEADARRNLAQFRASMRQFLHDPWLTDFIEDLQQASPEFRAWWPLHDVLIRPHVQKAMHHPEVGRLQFDYLTFQVHDAPGLLIVTLVPQEAETERKMRSLLERHPKNALLPYP